MKYDSLPAYLKAQLKARCPELFDPNHKHKPKRRGKYNAKRGYSILLKRTFHSKLERDRADILYLQEKEGKISSLKFQVPIQVGDITWRVDFTYVENGITWAEDAKGAEDPRFKMIKQIYTERGPYPLRISKRRTKTWKITTILPKTLPAEIRERISL